MRKARSVSFPAVMPLRPSVNLAPRDFSCFMSSDLDKAKAAAIAYAQKKYPNFKGMKASSAKLVDGKWVVEIHWLISERTAAGIQDVRVTLTSNFDVIEYEETGFRGVAGG